MNQPKFKGLYIPGEFTSIVMNDRCIHPKFKGLYNDNEFYNKITGCGNKDYINWTCKYCLANPTNIEIAKQYFRLKKLKELDDEST